jgi:hypothetical protein
LTYNSIDNKKISFKEKSFEETNFDDSGESKEGPEYLSGPPVDKFYAEDRQLFESDTNGQRHTEQHTRENTNRDTKRSWKLHSCIT